MAMAYAQQPNINFVGTSDQSWRQAGILTDKYVDGRLITAAEQWNNLWGTKDAAYLLTPDEVTKVQTEIQKVLRWQPLADTISPTVNIGEGMTRFEWYKWLDVNPPRLTQTFEGGNDVKPLKQATTNYLYGMDYDFHLDKVTIDAARSSNGKIKLTPDLQMGTLSNLTEQLALYRNWFIFRGSDIPGVTDIGIKGLVNDSNLTDPGAMGIGADDDLTAAGDVFHSAVVLANKLLQNKFQPPFDLHMTPKVFSQANKNRNTTSDKTDYKLITEYSLGAGAVFKTPVMNPFLIDSATETTSTGAMACFKSGQENFFTAQSYNLGYYPMPPKGLGVDGKLLWMGAAIVTRPTAIQFVDALTTNT
jgi:hypothetical protein